MVRQLHWHNPLARHRATSAQIGVTEHKS
ncbi:hypothetical protein BDFB_008076 [Asbolus verrucosus]|uniref:Uncharacterized protein n=1 Tax=Asbolus verrucosus TaxID=1661398 RepID=A0A482VTS7_ASBVE|nr:hypothetical protein BDFB_008076 [Asbolus verrucosus]